MAQPDPDKIVADIDRRQNEEDLSNLNKYVVNPVKAAGKKLYENVMGTPEQNRMAQERMDKAKKAKGMKAGGKVSSASKRADGCAIRGKTKGRMV
jgi:hypothetical protein